MDKGRKIFDGAHISIPQSQLSASGTPNSAISPVTPTTPKTPADEGLEFFASAPTKEGDPIRVYELRLDPDGGPNKDRQVSVSLWIILEFEDKTFLVHTFAACMYPLRSEGFLRRWNPRCQQRHIQDQLPSRRGRVW
jgi:hypothetical protein